MPSVHVMKQYSLIGDLITIMCEILLLRLTLALWVSSSFHTNQTHYAAPFSLTSFFAVRYRFNNMQEKIMRFETTHARRKEPDFRS